jgi:hypothetical protein
VNAPADQPKVCAARGCRQPLPAQSGRAGAASTAHRGAGGSALPEAVHSGSKSTTTATPITGGRPVGCGSSGCDGGTPKSSSPRNSEGHQRTIWPVRLHNSSGDVNGRREVRWSRKNGWGPVVDYLNVGLRDNANVDTRQPVGQLRQHVLIGAFRVQRHPDGEVRHHPRRQRAIPSLR